VVTELQFSTAKVTGISPVRALTGLRSLDCSTMGTTRGPLADLAPLKGMKLTTLDGHRDKQAARRDTIPGFSSAAKI
jgi:hypothetical protein